MVSDIITSDWFNFVVSLAGVIAAIISVIAALKANKIVKKQKKDSNKINRQNQNATGKNITQVGRDLNRGNNRDF